MTNKKRKTMTMTCILHPERVTFETLIAFLTIENNNLNIHSDPCIKSERDSIRNSCDVLIKEEEKLKKSKVVVKTCSFSYLTLSPDRCLTITLKL